MRKLLHISIAILTIGVLFGACKSESNNLASEITSELPDAKRLKKVRKKKVNSTTKTKKQRNEERPKGELNKKKETIAKKTTRQEVKKKTPSTVKQMKEKADARPVDKVPKKTATARKTKKKIEKKVSKSKKRPKIKFKAITFDYDTITEGDIVKHDFTFVNAGNENLEIKKTDVSCGCTVPSYPFLSIAPGDKGKIGAVFNSVGKSGDEESHIDVYSNGSNEPVVLTIKGHVLSKSESKTK